MESTAKFASSKLKSREGSKEYILQKNGPMTSQSQHRTNNGAKMINSKFMRKLISIQIQMGDTINGKMTAFLEKTTF